VPTAGAKVVLEEIWKQAKLETELRAPGFRALAGNEDAESLCLAASVQSA
jgi:hypothetical protein